MFSILFLLYFICIFSQVAFIILFIKSADNIRDRKFALNYGWVEYPTVTILICAKNEAKNIKSNFSSILNQQYPSNNWQVLVINDASTDNTLEVLNTFQDHYHNLKVISIPEDVNHKLPGKKHALFTGIKHIDTELVLLTDADCSPNSELWLSEMVKRLIRVKADIILGYSPYQKEKGFLNQFIQFETLHTAIQYASYALKGKAYMGVGRNLLYKTWLLKQAIHDENLKDILLKTNSGDDDLIISYFSNTKHIDIATNPATFVNTVPPRKLKSYFKQKSRHTSSSKYYQNNTKISLSTYAFTHFFSYFLFIFLFINSLILFDEKYKLFFNTLFIFLFYLVMKLIVLYKWRKIYHTKSSLVALLFSDFLWCFYNLIFTPYIFWTNKSKWN